MPKGKKSTEHHEDSSTPSRRRNVRNKKIIKENVKAISKGSLRRLARRSGVKRMGMECFEELRKTIRNFVSKLVDDSCKYAEYAKRTTITVGDVVSACRNQGKPIYGH